MKKTSQKMSKWTFLRLCLSGAIAGVAVSGIVMSSFQIDSSNLKDLVGGVTGAGIVAYFKMTHLI